jgi:hypothetical protein
MLESLGMMSSYFTFPLRRGPSKAYRRVPNLRKLLNQHRAQTLKDSRVALAPAWSLKGAVPVRLCKEKSSDLDY